MQDEAETPGERVKRFWWMPMDDLRRIMNAGIQNRRQCEVLARLDAITIYTLRAHGGE
jgi:hypothetical protein